MSFLFGSALGSRAQAVITPAVATVAARRAVPRYGIRERLDLSKNLSPTAGALGTLHWTVVSETPTNTALYSATGAGVLTPVNTVVATATYQCPKFPARVRIELRQADEGMLDRKEFDVIAPDQAVTYLVQFGPTHHVNGFATIAFEGSIVFGPPDVSFSGLEFQESRGTQTNSGLRPDMIRGTRTNHAPTNAGGILAWIPYRDMAALGSRMNGMDTVGNWAIYPAPAGWNAERQVLAQSTWPIQWKYRLRGDTDTGVIFKYARHDLTVYSNGDVELKKAGVELRRSLGDPTNHCHAWSGFADPPHVAVPWPVTARPAPPASNSLRYDDGRMIQASTNTPFSPRSTRRGSFRRRQYRSHHRR